MRSIVEARDAEIARLREAIVRLVRAECEHRDFTDSTLVAKCIELVPEAGSVLV